MSSFVISLLHADERRHHIVNEFGKKQVEFEFFDAITPELNVAQAQKLGINLENTVLGPGEISCLLSHVTLWHHAVTEQLPYITIFEDDVFLGANAGVFLNEYQWIPKNCDVIKLEGFSPQIITSVWPMHRLPSHRKLYRLKHKHMGAAGYVLSLRAARELLEYARNHYPLRPVDHIVFDDYILVEKLPILQIVPALCIQDYILHHKDNQHNALPSYLEQDRLEIRKIFPKFKSQKVKLSLFEKVKKEVWRPVQQVLQFPKVIKIKCSVKTVKFK